MATTAPTPVTLRNPSRYNNNTSPPTFTPPTQAFTLRTWTVSHSTLKMWRSARNVRITYTSLPPSKQGHVRIDDLVEYEKKSDLVSADARVKTVQGIDTSAKTVGGSSSITTTAAAAQSNTDATQKANTEAATTTADAPSPITWNWRGKGFLWLIRTHWEILGWGERSVDPPEGSNEAPRREKWMVTWFAPTLFTEEGVDIYSDRQEGPSRSLLEEIMAELQKLDAPKVRDLVAKEMKEVAIGLPWGET